MVLAPISRRIFSCSALRTMLTSSMPSFRQILFSIWPRLEAAAVCTSAVCPSRRMVSVIASAVSGLTNHDAPSAGVVPSGSTWQSDALRQRYCAYMPPPIIDTVLPSRSFAFAPALTTTPAPSLPTGSDWSSLAARPFRVCGGTLAVTTVASPLPDTFALLMSAGPNSRPRSDGLSGVASTRTTTWSSVGSGTFTLASEISSVPSLLTSERSSRPVSATVAFMAFPSCCVGFFVRQ